MRVFPLLSGRLWRIAAWVVAILLTFAIVYSLALLLLSLTRGIRV